MPQEFRGFELDDFQVESIDHIHENKSVVVSAATGTGKTLIADFVIDKYLRAGKDIIYTAPIKALSNQKYNDFKEIYGEDKVGILTGDVTINHDAPLRIMTTEIYRNMLLSQDPEVDDVAYVIFDEVHFLGDRERGTVWEESIIFSKEHTRFLCLSATIPNADQFAGWIEHVKGHDVSVVEENDRAVPLKHQFYGIENGFGTINELKTWKKQERESKFRNKKTRKKYFKKLNKKKRTVHVDLVQELKEKDRLPCLYFCFSRKKTQKKARILAGRKNLVTGEERKEITKISREYFREAEESVKELKTSMQLRQCIRKGVAFHHAGLLPTLKELVEELFNKGLIKALFATETFAVGINMPANTVCFDSLEKFDGRNFRYLKSKEYFQLAGRAGRRGIDDVGYVISVVEQHFDDLDKIKSITTGDKEPLKSQFKLSYNTVLNLINNHDEEKIDELLESSFYTYQKFGKGGKNIKNDFEKKKAELKKKGYIEEVYGEEELTEKGLFACKIYTQELFVSEIFCSDITDNLSEKEILLILGDLMYEDREKTDFKIRKKNHSYSAFDKIKTLNYKDLTQYFRDQPMFILESFLLKWYHGGDFTELLEYTSMSEGDIVRLIRQILDLLQQVKHATMNEGLKEKLRTIQDKIDRDVIEVRF